MQDADRRPASNQRPILKSMSNFYVTDIFTSDLCLFSNSQIDVLFQILKFMAVSHLFKSMLH
jgi:hypothetical protein